MKEQEQELEPTYDVVVSSEDDSPIDSNVKTFESLDNAIAYIEREVKAELQDRNNITITIYKY